jgi:hypothetical protein
VRQGCLKKERETMDTYFFSPPSLTLLSVQLLGAVSHRGLAARVAAMAKGFQGSVEKDGDHGTLLITEDRSICVISRIEEEVECPWIV